MLDFIFEEKYQTVMENLKGKISEKTYGGLELFLVNTNLDYKQKDTLMQLISKILSEKVKESKPTSWEF